MTRRLAVLLVLLAVSVAGLLAIGLGAIGTEARRLVAETPPAPTAAPAYEATIALVPVATGLTMPTDAQFVPGAPGLAVVLQKTGRALLVRVPAPGAVPATAADAAVVLDERVRDEAEMGLLGMAFHSRYRDNGLLYANMNPAGDPMRTAIVEYELPTAELGKRVAARRRVVLELEQPYENHNGGQLQFGPDGMLYVGLGDGGAGGDPQRRAQNRAELLGKMLRLDVDHAAPGAGYAVPPDNPFVGKAGARPEIWASGLRNPWRFAFTPEGRLVVADVGQGRFEEVDVVARGDDLGWRTREGRHCFPPPAEDCAREGLVEPVFEYGRELGVSVTGGYVATGGRAPALRGAYVLGDYGSGRMWALRLAAPGAADAGARAEPLGQFPGRHFSTFARDEAGDLYVADLTGGELLAIVPR